MSGDLESEGLIVVPPGVAAGRARRTCAWIAFVLFLVTTVGSGAVDTLFPMKAPTLIGAEKIADARRRRSATLADGTLASLLEYDLRLCSRVRRSIGPYYSLILYHWFREATPKVLIGQGDWLFMATRATPPERPDAELAGVSACLFSAVHRRAAGVGVDFVMAPIPRKSVVHADQLPADFDPRPDVDRLLFEGLVERGVPTARIDLALEAAIPGAQLYFQADGHWTDLAARLAAEAIAMAGGFLVPEAERRGDLRQNGTERQDRNTLLYLGLELQSDAIGWVELDEVPRYDVFDEKGRVVNGFKAEQMTRIALTGTSFSARRKLPVYIAHFAQQPVFNAATQGVSLMANVREFFDEHRDALPETLVLELPVHQLLTIRGTASARLPRHAGAFFADTRPPGVSVLERLESDAADASPGAGRQRLLTLRRGELAHTGDGILALRLSGRVRGQPAELELHVGNVNIEIPWKSRQSEIVIPLISWETTNDNVVLQLVSGGEQLDLESIELVTELDRERGVVAVPAAPAREGNGWFQDLVLPEDTTVPALGGLVVQLSDGARPAADLRIEVAVEGREPRVFPASELHGGAWIALNLGGLAGGRVERLRLRASGPAQRAPVQSAALLPPYPARTH